MERSPELADARAACAVVDRYLPRASLELPPLLSEELGGQIHLKVDTFKTTRTFKVRGALNKIASLNPAARAGGVVAASAERHGQGVAYAAWALGVGATVVMPQSISPTMVGVCRGYGAKVLLSGDVYDDTLELAHSLVRDNVRALIHPYADPLIIAGQGTIGLALKARRPQARLAGVEPEGADAFRRSLFAGKPVELSHPHSIADKLVAKSTVPLNVELGRRFVDDVVTVCDTALAVTACDPLDRLSLLVEPSGATPLAAVRAVVDVRGKRAVLVVGCGNASPRLLESIVSERLATTGA